MDCLHFVRNGKTDEFGLCGLTENTALYSERYLTWMITGKGEEPLERKFPMSHCSAQRQVHGPCGPMARYFRPRISAGDTKYGQSAPVNQNSDNVTGLSLADRKACA